MAGDKALSGTYEYIISHQWDKDRCDRMGQYLADNAVDKFSSMPEPVIVPAMVLIPFGIVLGLSWGGIISELEVYHSIYNY